MRDFEQLARRLRLQTNVPADVILVSMDVTSLYTKIPQEEGINTVCQAYQYFYDNKPPIPVGYLRDMLSLILNKKKIFPIPWKRLLTNPWYCYVNEKVCSFCTLL